MNEWTESLSLTRVCILSIVFGVSDISVNALGVRRLFCVLYVYHERFQWLMGRNVPDNLPLF